MRGQTVYKKRNIYRHLIEIFEHRRVTAGRAVHVEVLTENFLESIKLFLLSRSDFFTFFALMSWKKSATD
jgi:hypothetical protein